MSNVPVKPISELEEKSEVSVNDKILILDSETDEARLASKEELRWEKGDTWEQWPQGEKWDKGDKWDKWDKWDQGEKWDTWAQWPQGIQWPKGDKWDKWDTWPQGTKWDKGDTGDTWPQGEKWDKWDKWDKGDKWDTGATWPQWPQWPVWPQWPAWEWSWDVIWPSGATDWDIVLFDWVTGKYIKDSGKSLNDMQEKLTAWTGIDITNNVISNTQTSAEWWNIEWDIEDQTDLIDALDEKLESTDLVAGDGITIAPVWSALPAWYTQVAYLQSSWSAVIGTDITWIWKKIVSTTNSDVNQTAVQVFTWYNSDYLWTFIWVYSNRWCAQNASWGRVEWVDANTVQDVTITFTLTGWLNKSEVTIWQSTWTFTRTAARPDGNLWIFWSIENNVVIGSYIWKIYTYKVYDASTDELIADLVPCLNSLSVPWFYDVVGNTFYPKTAWSWTISAWPAIPATEWLEISIDDSVWTDDNVVAWTGISISSNTISNTGVLVSTDTGNLLSTGVKLWLWDKADFDNLWTLDTNTIYAPITWMGGGGWYTPWANTIVYYPLTSTTLWNDQSWNNFNLTNWWGVAFGTYGWVDCGYFTTKNCLKTSTGNILNNWSSTFTWLAWMRFIDAGTWYPRIFTCSSQSNGLLVMQKDTLLVIWNSGINSWITYQTWGWHLYAITWNYSTGEFTWYVDTTSSSWTWNGSSYGSWLCIWGTNSTGTDIFNWYMSNIIYENKIRTAEEISAYYNATKATYGIS